MVDYPNDSERIVLRYRRILLYFGNELLRVFYIGM